MLKYYVYCVMYTTQLRSYAKANFSLDIVGLNAKMYRILKMKYAACNPACGVTFIDFMEYYENSAVPASIACMAIAHSRRFFCI